MTPVAALIPAAVLLAAPDIRQCIEIRDFTSAMELADSDSLEGLVLRKSGNHAAAAAAFTRAFEIGPSPGLFALVWEAVASSTEHYHGLVAGEMREELDGWGGELDWESPHLLSMVGSASSLGDSALSDSLAEELLRSFPDSREAYDILGREFYDALYPVWQDDSARVCVLLDLVEERGDLSDFWRSRAFRYALSSLLGTADSSDWERLHGDWLMSCPNDPQAFLSGAALSIERDSAFARALELAGTGLRLADGYRPAGMPGEEWHLTGPAMVKRLHFLRLLSMWKMGADGPLPQRLDSLIGITEFDMDDHHTESDLFWLKGSMTLALGDTSSALVAWSRSAMSGDVTDEWSSRSLACMDAILEAGMEPVEWAREEMDYRGPVFQDATHLLGPDSLLRGSRVSWCDWDRDGWPDLFAGNRLYRNDEGAGFTDVTSLAGLEGCRGNGGVWGDIDGDGYPDLVTAGDPVQVFLSSGDPVLEENSGFGVESTGAGVEGVALLDWDGDGWLDLYLASYEESGSLGSGTADAFYLGGGDGLRMAGDSLGMVPFLGLDLCGRGVSPCDFDMDGDIDIFVSNYRLQENFLWENVGGMAVNSALERGLAGTETEGWWGHTIGSAWGDWDNDGDWDMFSANLAHPRYITFSDRSMLYVNEGGYFRDVRSASGIRYEETHSSPVWGDFDNDGLLDLFITSVYPQRRSFLYRNGGEAAFEDVTWLSGSRIFNGWGAAAADFDLDGRLDLAVGTGGGPVLLRNVSGSGSWVEVKVEGYGGVNSSCIGCTVVLHQGDATLMRQVQGGSGTTSQDGPYLHFGLPGEGDCRLLLYAPGGTGAVDSARTAPGSLVVMRADQS